MKKYRAAFGTLTLLLCLTALTPRATAAAGTMSESSVGEEKRLRGRLGVGFTSQIATTSLGRIPALSAKYYMSRDFAASLGVGFDTRADNSAFALGGKLFRNVFHEPNLIFFLGLGLAYVNNKGNSLQGSAFLGSEFFFAQLPSLGFSFEAGLQGDNTSGSFAIRTTGDSFLTAGMHFYF